MLRLHRAHRAGRGQRAVRDLASLAGVRLPPDRDSYAWLRGLAQRRGIRGGAAVRGEGADERMGRRMTRPRRSCISVPGSSERFLAKATGLNADQVLLDLEDSVAPDAKHEARGNVAAALQTGDWGGKVRSVRVNGATTRWAYRDVADVVERAGQYLDTIILPKVTGSDHVAWLDLLLGQVEQAAGLARVEQIAGCSPRLEALVFGPADFMASLGMRSLEIGAQPAGYAGGDAFHYP